MAGQRCHTLIVGGGSAGSTVAARLLEQDDQIVTLVEAGPDYGHRDNGQWPARLLDGSGDWTNAAEWGFWNSAGPFRESYPLACGKLIGGSSAINAGGWNWPAAQDIAEWTQAIGDGWDFNSLLPWLQAIECDPHGPGQLHGTAGPFPVTRPQARLSPFFAAFVQAAEAKEWYWRSDINDASGAPGLLRRARNTRDGIRWNTAFGSLDQVRDRPRLTILPGHMAGKILFDDATAVGVEVHGPGGIEQRLADRIILTAGAYNSPALLLRSGIGPAEHLNALDIPVRANRPGVGAALQDHPVMTMRVLLTQDLAQLCATTPDLTPWQVVLRTTTHPSSVGFDLQIAPQGELAVEDGWECAIRVELMKPKSKGSVHLASPDPFAAPLINSALLTHPDDRADAIRGVEMVRDMMEEAGLCSAIVRERWYGADERGDALGDLLQRNAYSYHHPCGTCRMGDGDDPESVVDPNGRLHGFRNVFVADASIFPTIPRVPINVTVIANAARIADALCHGAA